MNNTGKGPATVPGPEHSVTFTNYFLIKAFSALITSLFIAQQGNEARIPNLMD